MKNTKQTFYAVTFEYGKKRMFAYFSRKLLGYDGTPSGVYPPESRCIFTDVKKAEKLAAFLKRDSTFKDIRIESRQV